MLKTGKSTAQQEACYWGLRVQEAASELTLRHFDPVRDVLRETPEEFRYSVDYLKLLEAALPAGAYAEASDELLTLFEEACRSDNQGMMSILVDAGLDYAGFGQHSYSPFHLACLYGRTACVDRMLQNYRGPFWEPWHLARSYLFPLVELKTRTGDYPIHLACRAGRVDLLRHLIHNGAHPSQRDEKGRSPLQLACRLGAADCVAELLARGALDALSSIEGQYCLYLATGSGQRDAVRCLLDAGLSPNGVPPGRTSPLHAAARLGDVELIQLLLDFGARPSPQDARGATPAHDAAHFGRMEALIQLVEAGANLSIKDAEGRTVQDLLAIAERTDGIEQLQAALEERHWGSVDCPRVIPSIAFHPMWAAEQVESLEWLQKRFHLPQIPGTATKIDIHHILLSEGVSMGIQERAEDGAWIVHLQDPSESHPLAFRVPDPCALQGVLEALVDWHRPLSDVSLQVEGLRANPLEVRVEGLPCAGEPALYWPLQNFCTRCLDRAFSHLVEDVHSAQTQHVRNYLWKMLADEGIHLPVHLDASTQDSFHYYGDWAFGSEHDALHRFLAFAKYELAIELYRSLNWELENNPEMAQDLEALFLQYLSDRILEGRDRKRVAHHLAPMRERLAKLASIERTLKRALVMALKECDGEEEALVRFGQRWALLQKDQSAEARVELNLLNERPGVQDIGELYYELAACGDEMAECRRKMDKELREQALDIIYALDWMRRSATGVCITQKGVLALSSYMGWWTDLADTD